MPLIKKLLLAFLGVFVILSLISVFQPSQWEVKRSIVIDAPAEKIYPFINNLRKWSQWTPWSKETDITLSWSYEGPESGPGAMMRWEGNNTASGEILILRSEPARGVWYEYNMADGRMIVNGEITLTPQEGSAGPVEVTWRDHGDTGSNLFARLFAATLDEVVGANFEKGLARLKKVAELSR